MENNNNLFLGKIEKSTCYINNGKYGYFLTLADRNSGFQAKPGQYHDRAPAPEAQWEVIGY